MFLRIEFMFMGPFQMLLYSAILCNNSYPLNNHVWDTTRETDESID